MAMYCNISYCDALCQDMYHINKSLPTHSPDFQWIVTPLFYNYAHFHLFFTFINEKLCSKKDKKEYYKNIDSSSSAVYELVTLLYNAFIKWPTLKCTDRWGHWLSQAVALGPWRKISGSWWDPECFWLSQKEKHSGARRQHSVFVASHTEESHRERPLWESQGQEQRKGATWGKLCQYVFFFFPAHLFSTWARTAASEVFFGEQAQGSAVHLETTLFWPAQRVLLLSPVEPVGNILLIPQRWVNS